MRFKTPLILVLVAALSVHLVNASNPLAKGDILRAITLSSMNDGIPAGWCGRAMLSLLTDSGLGRGLKSGNGQDWEHILSAAGWKAVRVATPRKAPLGSVLVYTSDRRLGRPSRGTPGGSYGHVEIVALSPEGGRIYVADSARLLPGGSVPDNFTGRAWVPPGSLLSSPAPIVTQVEILMGERLKMAKEFFQSQTATASLETGSQTLRLR